MAKDYHKGVKLQCYISDELSQKVDNYIQNYNRYVQDYVHDYDSDGIYKCISKADVIRLAITEFLEKHDINS